MRGAALAAAAAALCAGLVSVPSPAGAQPSSRAALLAGAASTGRPGLAEAGSDGPLSWTLPPADPEGGGSGRGISPVLAGLMSAVVPGTGQLVQGQSRGWVYLGAEAAAWFSVLALRSAGNQAQEDYRRFVGDPDQADSRWSWDRYDTVTDCGEGLGPRNPQQERENLMRLYDFSRDEFYDDIGNRDVYACGWMDQADRARFQRMWTNSRDLFASARWVVAAAVLNHVVSAVDATKSASTHRKEAGFSWDWNVAPTPRGDLALNMEVRRSF